MIIISHCHVTLVGCCISWSRYWLAFEYALFNHFHCDNPRSSAFTLAKFWIIWHRKPSTFKILSWIRHYPLTVFTKTSFIYNRPESSFKCDTTNCTQKRMLTKSFCLPFGDSPMRFLGKYSARTAAQDPMTYPSFWEPSVVIGEHCLSQSLTYGRELWSDIQCLQRNMRWLLVF